MRRDWTTWAATWAVAAVVAGCGSDGYGGGGSPAPAQCTAANATTVTSAIAISGTAFVPACAKVAQNTAVTFTNSDGITHTVTTDPAQPETFDSGAIAPAATFNHTFAVVGTIGIHCSIHPGMKLTVIVQ